MHQFMCLAFQVILIICALLFCCCEATSIRLSPLGMVSVCSGGQVLLTCERMSGSFLFWTVSIPRLAMSREVIVSSQGAIDTTALQFNGLHATEFNIYRTSDSPLISQMLINNVTTEINGSTIYCSEDGDENGASAVAVNVINKSCSLNVSLVNQLFGNNSVIVTLQWPQEAGAVYHVNAMPHIESITNHNTSTVVINLTISYNIHYNVSIVSSLCGVTITRALKYYATCDLPTQLLHDPVAVVSGSYREGKFITYTCPPGFILTGPNASVCTGNGEWEPDPGRVDCIADCGVPFVDRNVTLNYSSTLAGSRSVLVLTCESDIPAVSIIKQIITVTCQSSGNWIPDPTQFTCSETSLIPPVQTGSGTINLVVVFSSTIVVMFVVSSIVFLSIGYACGWFSQKHKQLCTSKADNENNNEGSQLPPTPGPLYEELQQRSTPEHQDLVELKENVAYGPIIK